ARPCGAPPGGCPARGGQRPPRASGPGLGEDVARAAGEEVRRELGAQLRRQRAGTGQPVLGEVERHPGLALDDPAAVSADRERAQVQNGPALLAAGSLTALAARALMVLELCEGRDRGRAACLEGALLRTLGAEQPASRVRSRARSAEIAARVAGSSTASRRGANHGCCASAAVVASTAR